MANGFVRAVALPAVMVSLLAYRQAWIDAGCLYRGTVLSAAPPNWSAEAALDQLKQAAPYLMLFLKTAEATPAASG